MSQEEKDKRSKALLGRPKPPGFGKHLIESKRMMIVSRPLISELKTFVAHGSSYAAKPGETDDLVMSLILIVRMAQMLQSFDSQLDLTMKDSLEDIIEPMPFFIT